MSEIAKGKIFRMSAAMTATLTVVGAGGVRLGEHITAEGSGVSPPHCDVNYLTGNLVPRRDKRRRLVAHKLGIAAGEMNAVEWFPAMCDIHGEEQAFRHGITGSSTELAPQQGAGSFADCVVYPAHVQLMPEVGRHDHIGVMACFQSHDILNV